MPSKSLGFLLVQPAPTSATILSIIKSARLDTTSKPHAGCQERAESGRGSPTSVLSLSRSQTLLRALLDRGMQAPWMSKGPEVEVFVHDTRSRLPVASFSSIGRVADLKGTYIVKHLGDQPQGTWCLWAACTWVAFTSKDVPGHRLRTGHY